MRGRGYFDTDFMNTGEGLLVWDLVFVVGAN